MSKLWSVLCNVGSWLKRHFDFALILAAAVEIPRWTVTFLAIHEPLWVGIPLGALLDYATSEGWKAYFTDPHRYKLLAFNVVSLLAATFVITPVLFSMASAPIDEIDLAALLPPVWLLAWSAVLAVTTFAPLIQLAAVKSTPVEKEQEATTTSTSATSPVESSLANPVGTAKAVESSQPAAPEPAAAPKQPEPDAMPQPDKRTQAMQLRDEGYTAAEIAKMTDAKYSTVQSWLRRATAQTNGVHQ